MRKVDEWNVSLFAAKYIPFKGKLAAQTTENCVENQKAAKKDVEIGGNGGHHKLPVVATTARGQHHGQAVVVSSMSVLSLPTSLRFDTSLGSWFLTQFGRGGMFRTSLIMFFDPHDLKIIFSSHVLSL